MVRTVKKNSFNAYNWVTSQDTILHTFLNTFVNCTEEFFRYYTTNNFFSEFVFFTSSFNVKRF
ncbi:Uncharacterised protein [Acinetobacter baumannii]|nr:Uncharacterised protein [Acinetobacter baumannii]